MKVGDLIEFTATDALATIIELKNGTDFQGRPVDPFCHLMVHGDVLKNTPSSDGLTWMRLDEVKRLAEVVG